MARVEITKISSAMEKNNASANCLAERVWIIIF